MAYSSYKRQRILHYYLLGYKAPTIVKLLREEKLLASRQGIQKFLIHYRKTGSIEKSAGSGRRSKISEEVRNMVENQMRLDDETTAYQLHSLLTSKGIAISLRTILRCRTSLGWTFRGSSYCQLIRTANKTKRLEWAQQHRNDTFDEVIWTDECTVQLETHRRFCCRKRGEPPRNKPTYDAPILVF